MLAIEHDDARSYGRLVRDADGTLARIVEAARRDAATSSRSREVELRIYVFRAEKLWPALDRLEPHNAQGELYLTDTIGLLVADGEPVAVHVAPEPFEVEASTPAPSSPTPRPVLRDRINRGHMLAGVTIVDPATTWIEPDVEIEPDVDDPPVRRPPRPHAGRDAAPRSTPTRVAVDAEIGTGAIGRPILLPSPRNGPRGGFEGGNLRGDQELTHRAADEGAAPVVHRRRRHRRGHEHRRRRDHRELRRTSPASRRAGRGSARTSGPASTMASSPPSRWETEHGQPPDR